MWEHGTSEAVVQKRSAKTVQKNFANSQEVTCTGVSFYKVTKLWPGTLIEKGTPAHLFSCKFPASILNSLFVKHVNDYLCNMQRYYNSISRMMFSKQYSQSLSIVTLKGELTRC